MNNKALVVIDIQNDITKHYRDIIGNINAAIEWATAEGMQRACIYFSLMCGAMLILGGSIVHMLCGKAKEHPFLRTPLLLTYIILVVDGILAVCFMPHNPCAWVIFVLSILLLVVPKYK